jgi:hypothetical protein
VDRLLRPFHALGELEEVEPALGVVIRQREDRFVTVLVGGAKSRQRWVGSHWSVASSARTP